MRALVLAAVLGCVGGCLVGCVLVEGLGTATGPFWMQAALCASFGDKVSFPTPLFKGEALVKEKKKEGVAAKRAGGKKQSTSVEQASAEP